MEGTSAAEEPTGPPPTTAATGPLPPAVRAQLLATEHWGLLASRSTAQSEVLTRIAIFLTLVSAGLVGIGLLGQISRFESWFAPAALGILGFLWMVGTLTLVRVANASEEDMMFVVAMNRLRGAYVDLDPEIEKYFLASANDDEVGVAVTYSFMRERRASHLLGSSGFLITVVTSTLLGLLTGGVAVTLGASTGLAIGVGAAFVLGQVLASFGFGAWTYTTAWRQHVPLRRSPATVRRRAAVRPPGTASPTAPATATDPEAAPPPSGSVAGS